jgi:predicted membrane-bound spermidine synthase
MVANTIFSCRVSQGITASTQPDSKTQTEKQPQCIHREGRKSPSFCGLAGRRCLHQQPRDAVCLQIGVWIFPLCHYNVPVKKTGKPEGDPLSPGLRRFLYLTVFVTGGAILIVEILGAKMLSPFFGTSHFVWTAQIAVTLLSLSVGYWFGGMLVDRCTDLRILYRCILGAGAYLAMTIPFCPKVAYVCLEKMPLAVGSLFAAAFLFFVPLTLLAVTSPFLIRVFTTNVETLGGNVGRLYAVGTVGSVAGTILIGYVLIPLLPNSQTMLITAGVLMSLPLVHFVVWRNRAYSNTGAVVLVLVAGSLGVRGVQLDGKAGNSYMTEIDRTNSNYGLMQVLELEGGGLRYYLNDYLTQNTYDPETGQSTSLFTHMLHGLAKVYTRETKDVLCIGVGVGIVPMLFANEDSKVDAVEINDKIPALAAKHFGFEPEKLNLTIGDGRQFVNSSAREYDAVILDAFLGDSSPSHLMSQEAFTQMKRVLKPEGVLVINMFGEFEPGKDFFTASLDKTLKSVFGTVRIHTSGNGNVFFVATPATALVQYREFDYASAYPTMVNEAERAMDGIRQVNSQSGIILTDDYNPVDVRDSATREEHRRSLAMNMRNSDQE